MSATDPKPGDPKSGPSALAQEGDVASPLAQTTDARHAESGDGVPAAPASRAGSRRAVGLLYNYSVLWALVVEVVIFSLLRPHSFFTTANAQSILGSQAILLVVALGLTIPLAVNEFDLSVGAMVGFSEVILGALTVQQHWALVPAVIATVALCAGVGLINAILVVRIGVGAFIATLAMGTVLIGIATRITNDQPIPGIPQTLTSITASKFLGIELVFWYALVGTFVLWYVLSQTPVGRRLYFTGANRDAARLNGIAVGRLRGGALVASAVIASIAGILYSGVFATADPTTAQDQFLLPAFAAAFLGATAVTPGRFNAWGTFISVYVVVTGITGLSLVTNQVGWIAFVFNGGILLVAVVTQRLVAARRQRAEASRY
jgi:ribose transport system permease protein